MTTPDGPAMTPTDLLDRANHLPFSEEEREVIHEALSLARETGDEDTEYRARLALTASYRSIDDSPSFLTHFSAAAVHARPGSAAVPRSRATAVLPAPVLAVQGGGGDHHLLGVSSPGSRPAAILDQMEAHISVRRGFRRRRWTSRGARTRC
jgi:hypothetical protein